MKKTCLLTLLSLLLFSTHLSARDQITIVGSSTVYPFATVVAENFGLATKFKTPKIESTGTGGGMKLFCDDVGIKTPDITNASRAIKSSERKKCEKNGIFDPIEVKIGYDGIVFAQAKGTKPSEFTLREIYLALVKDIPNPDGSNTFVPNPYKNWRDISPQLPNKKIEVLGPPPTSGTRDAFVEMALEGGCKTFDWIKAMKKADKKVYQARCHAIREDGAYIETGENDNLIVQKLSMNKDAYGIFGYSFLNQNRNKVQGALVEGFDPSFENISNGKYPIARSLYFYVKKQHVGVIPGIAEFVKEFISSQASGEEGYLADKGLIPLPTHEMMERNKRVRAQL